MKKETNGFGNKNNSKRKRDDRSKKKKTSYWQLKSKKPKTEETAERSPVKRRPSYDVLNVKIADIKITGRRRALKPAKVNELAESISSLGLQSPITVRLVKRDLGWGKTKTEWVLVSGLHRIGGHEATRTKKDPLFNHRGWQARCANVGDSRKFAPGRADATGARRRGG